MSRPQPRDRRMLIAATALALAASAPSGRRGRPVTGSRCPEGWTRPTPGVLSPDGTQRYLALPQGGQGGQTVVERIDAERRPAAERDDRWPVRHPRRHRRR